MVLFGDEVIIEFDIASHGDNIVYFAFGLASTHLHDDFAFVGIEFWFSVYDGDFCAVWYLKCYVATGLRVIHLVVVHHSVFAKLAPT